MLAAHGYEPTDSLLGTELPGGYRIERLLSRGGMGAVYQAEQLRFRRRAVKVLTILAERASSLRVRAEAEIVSGVEHPHVVRVLDAGRTDHGIPFLVMEYLEGEHLRSGSRAIACCRCWKPCASFVSVLGARRGHARGYVHCDLKPSNVFLVKADGLPDVVKLLDFGVSVASGHLRTDEVREIAGTPSYMAPEQMQGRPDLDHRVDQFSIAAMAYEMLSGKKAFSPDMPFVEPRPLSESAPWVPSDLEPVLRRAFSRERELRYSSISRFAWSLEKAGTHACMEPAHALGSTLAMSRYHLAGLREEHVFAQTEPSSCPPTRVEARVKMLRAVSSAQSRAEALFALARRYLNEGQLDLAEAERSSVRLDPVRSCSKASRSSHPACRCRPHLAARVGSFEQVLVVRPSQRKSVASSRRVPSAARLFGSHRIASATPCPACQSRHDPAVGGLASPRGALNHRASVAPPPQP